MMARMNGWPLLGVISAVLAGWTGWVTFAGPDAVEATREAVRLTARTSLILFVLAFVASGVRRLWQGMLTGWLLANRRMFGLGFVVSHLLHAAVLVRLWRLDPVLFDDLTTAASFIAGGLCYAVILALGVTSFLPVRRRLSPRAWSRLHSFGVWFIWLFFLVNFGRRAAVNGMYWPAMLIIALALVLRMMGRQKRRPATVVIS
jgi:methionine sulfoxide reductase heme-binding subunit